VLALFLLELLLLAFFLGSGCAARCCWFGHSLGLRSQVSGLRRQVC
jgi:hypothetical protein